MMMMMMIGGELDARVCEPVVAQQLTTVLTG